MRRLLLPLALLLWLATLAPADDVIRRLEADRATVHEVLRLFSDLTGLIVVASPQAGQTEVTLSLRNVDAELGLELLCKAAGLWHLRTPAGVHRVLTAPEYQREVVVETSDTIQVFTLLYPRADAVATTVRNLYGSRVRLSYGPEENLYGVFNSSGDNSLQTGSGANFRSSSSGSSFGRGDEESGAELAERATAEQLAAMSARDEALSAEEISEALGNVLPIYVTIDRTNNLIIVRCSEPKVMASIERLIIELDRPTPQVLLEVKILELSLDDNMSSVFDLDLIDGTTQAGPPTSQPRNPLLTSSGTGYETALGLGNFPLQGGTLIYQFMDEHIRARMQLLKGTGRIRSLATPLLLCANEQPSRLFVGEERPLVRNFDVLTTTTEGVTTDRIVPEVDLRDIGNTLRIFPSINADRTVALRIIQDVSSVNIGGASLPIPTSGGDVQEVRVDTVTTANIEGTVIGRDGLTLAVGGLIRKEVSQVEEGLPLLMDIPVIGFLFRETEVREVQRELVLLITPRIITTPAEGEATTRARLQALSLHPYTWRGEDGVAPFDRADLDESPDLLPLLEEFLHPIPEPLP